MAFNFSSNENDTMRLSVAPSLDEKINFLIQNYSKDDNYENGSLITIDDIQSAAGTISLTKGQKI